MTSRLDRLFTLLETGSSESIKHAAAKQLGEVQKTQQKDLELVLNKLRDYAFKSSWDTRVAAGHATRYVLEAIDISPELFQSNNSDTNSDNKQTTRNSIEAKIIQDNVNILKTLREFNLEEIMDHICKLSSVNDKTAEIGDQSTSKIPNKKGSKSVSKQDKLMRQRVEINKELGIDINDKLNLGVKSTDIVTNDDLQTSQDSDASQDSLTKDTGAHVIYSKIKNYSNLVQLLSKANCLQTLSEFENQEEPTDCDINPTMHLKVVFQLADKYSCDLFNPSWEIRHGSAIALREFVKTCGKFIGQLPGLSRETNKMLNQLWLVDQSMYCLSILALDRFGDFLFDQVVAPVRENVSQVLSCCLMNLDEDIVVEISKLISKFMEHSSWEARHSGLLVMKYTLQIISATFAETIMKRYFDLIVVCLRDSFDDVANEAATVFVSNHELLLRAVPERLQSLIELLWTQLDDLDELNSSTGNIVLLLTTLLSNSTFSPKRENLPKYLTSLWSKLKNASMNARLSVQIAILSLLKSIEQNCASWMDQKLFSSTMCLTFQQCMIENEPEILNQLELIWKHLIQMSFSCSKTRSTEQSAIVKASSKFVNYWLSLIIHPNTTPLDLSNTLWYKIDCESSTSGLFTASVSTGSDSLAVQKTKIVRCRISCCKLVGYLFAVLCDKPSESLEISETFKHSSEILFQHLNSTSANKKIVSCWALNSWAKYNQEQLNKDGHNNLSLSQQLIDQLNKSIRQTALYYDELMPCFTRLQQNTRDFIESLNASKIDLTNFKLPAQDGSKRIIYTLSQMDDICRFDITQNDNLNPPKKPALSSPKKSISSLNDKVLEQLIQKQKSLLKCANDAKNAQQSLSTSVLSSVASASLAWNIFPENLDLFVNPLLNSCMTEDDEVLQNFSAVCFVDLIIKLAELNNSKRLNEIFEGSMFQTMLKNLLVCQDGDAVIDFCDMKEFNDTQTIILLNNINQKAIQMRHNAKRKISISTCLKRAHSSVEDSTWEDSLPFDKGNEKLGVKVKGASLILKGLIVQFSQKLATQLPQLWSLLELTSANLEFNELVKRLRIQDIVWEHLHGSIQKKLISNLPQLLSLIEIDNPYIRHLSCKCIGTMSRTSLSSLADQVISSVLPLLEDYSSVSKRCGAIECLASIIQSSYYDLIDYCHLLILPILRKMSDQIEPVRLMSAYCFGQLISLTALSNSNSTKQSSNKVPSSESSGNFLEELFNQKSMKEFKLPFKLNAQLRSYQQEGINWLAFLQKFNLNGILCDDMGLGKTLMTISIVAALYADKQEQNSLPSLIVCPTTLTGHWIDEIDKFLNGNDNLIRPFVFHRKIDDKCKQELLSKTACKNIIVTSYDSVRLDVKFFSNIEFNYCVLDEGHVIKNGKTKLFQAIKQIKAKHRLILSGTPIQNNVVELWCLFDFLMPGYLGTEAQFNSQYSKPILQSRDQKSSSRDKEYGVLAMESLHRKILPFLLRRSKSQVLADLPPKIIQDYVCELSLLQAKLYEDFSKAVKKDRETDSDKTQSTAKGHIFQALRYLKNVCNHPKLVFNEQHPQYTSISSSLNITKHNLTDIVHSSKLVALKQLLLDCGIGTINSDNLTSSSSSSEDYGDIQLEPVVMQHRVLIFCQLKSMIDIIEHDLLKKHLPSATYLRLDGSVAPNLRHDIVKNFNNDPSIDILLLTTQIGGLGLNLTGADTVIFVDHDWNPTKDLQAMDRAHRIGQKKVVNVFRLLTKNTIEQKIMSLQQFKTNVAETVISEDNSNLDTMQVDHLFDLFTEHDAGVKESASKQGASNNLIDFLPELWTEESYETEYDLKSFISSLKKT